MSSSNLLLLFNRAAAQGASPYALQDNFTVALAAGAVIGTPATPGPGIRRGLDTGNHWTITGGYLTDTGVTASFSDPMLMYSVPITRELGKTAFFTLNFVAGAAGYIRVGFGSNIAVNPTENIIATATPGQWFPDTSAAGTYIDDYRSASRNCAITLRAAGQYHYVYVGGHWEMMWHALAGTSSTLYFGMGIDTGAPRLSALSLHKTLRFIPAPVASDGFNRANGAIGTTDGTGHQEANGGGGLTWTAQSGTWTVATNKAAASGAGAATVDCGKLDIIHEAFVYRAAGSAGVIVRWKDANNYVRASHDGTNVVLEKVVAGTLSTVRTTAKAYVAGAPLRVIVKGTAFRVYYNYALVGAQDTIGDADLQTGTAVGLYASDAGNTWDNMTTFAKGTAGEYDNLNVH